MAFLVDASNLEQRKVTADGRSILGRVAIQIHQEVRSVKDAGLVLGGPRSASLEIDARDNGAKGFPSAAEAISKAARVEVGFGDAGALRLEVHAGSLDLLREPGGLRVRMRLQLADEVTPHLLQLLLYTGPLPRDLLAVYGTSPEAKEVIADLCMSDPDRAEIGQALAKMGPEAWGARPS